MNFLERIIDAGASLLVAIVAAAFSYITYLARQVNTNRKQTEMLLQDIAHRDQLREIDRKDIIEVKESVKRIEGWIVQGRDK